MPPARQCLLEKQTVQAVREECSKVDSLTQSHFQDISRQTYLEESSTCQRPDGEPNLQRPIPIIRGRIRQANRLKRALRFTSGVLVEAGAAIVIHNYRPLRERADLDGWYRSHAQSISSSEHKKLFSLLLEQMLRWWSSPAQRGELLSRTREMVRDPGPGTFVSLCAVFTLYLVHLLQHTSHHRYQNTFILWGAVCGLLVGVLTARHEMILVDALTAYLPSTIIGAQILSIVLHSMCASWRDPETCEQASKY